MKVTCQQCGTAYSVADSKVAGRKVKLRCKQCDEAMIIDGTAVRADAHDGVPIEAGASEADAAPISSSSLEPVSAPPPAPPEQIPPAYAGAFDGEGEFVRDDETAQVLPVATDWHVAVGDETQGPYTLDEVARHYAEGQIAADTLVYRDGASDWQAAGEIAELTSAATVFAPPRAPRPSAPPPRRAEPRRLEAVAVPMGSDPFDDRPPVAVSGPLTANDMLGSTLHEGTVQFSLDAIRAISAVSSPSVVPAAVLSSSARPPASSYLSSGLTSPGYTSPGYTSPGFTPGYASGGGSGLIDVSALNAQQLEESPFHVISNAQRSPLDMHTPYGVMTEARGGGAVELRTKVFAGLSALGFVLVALVTALALTRTPEAQPVASASNPPMQAGLVALPTRAPIPEPVAAPAAVEPTAQAAAEAPAAGEDEANANEPARSAGKSRPRTTAKPVNAKRVGAEVAAKAPSAAQPKEPKVKAGANAASASSEFDDLLAGTPTKKPSASKGNQSIDDLLDSAVSAKKQPPKPEPAAAASDLPATPSRDAMRAAYGKATAKAVKCKGSGVATADVTIAGSSGRASSVSVSGVDGAAKSCVESAVRSTTFPKFQKDSMQVKFPFKLPG